MKNKRGIQQVLGGLACLSLIITLIESYYYYLDYADYPMFHLMLVLQNSVKAFVFQSDIGIEDVLNSFQNETEVFRRIIDYAYIVAVLVAPMCTITALYKVFETLLKWNVRLNNSKNDEHIIIFGYNDNVRKLLKDQTKDKRDNGTRRRIYVVSPDEIPVHEETQLLEKNVIYIQQDLMEASHNEWKKLQNVFHAESVKAIILMEESSMKNFSLYYMLQNQKDSFHSAIKFYCQCEDEAVKKIIEEYYDETVDSDLEIFSITEMEIRKVFREHPLYDYYMNQSPIPPVKDWHVHLVIVGFGTTGQQMLLQAMSQGVMHSQNKILIDVIDSNMKEKKEIFASHFSSKYMKMDEENDEYVINGTDADGELRIRFHKMDVRYKKFQQMLTVLAEELPITYIAISIPKLEMSISCMMDVEVFLEKQKAQNVYIGLRVDDDSPMAQYLSENKKRYKNVFIMDGICSTLTMDEILAEKINAEAKKYNYFYHQVQWKEKDRAPAKHDENITIDSCWQKMKFFQQVSNRELSYHAAVKRVVLQRTENAQDLLKKHLGTDGVIRKINGVWSYDCSEEKLVEYINSSPFLCEMAKMEHRRWCYALAAKGWKNAGKRKNMILKENPCLCNWKKLCKERPEMCKYDLQPLMMMVQNTND